MTFSLGLTGSIAMGKSTTANMFRAHGCDIWDADKAVGRLYEKGGAAVDLIGDRFPGVINNGMVNRISLKERLAADESGFPDLEKIVHPLVKKDRQEFRKQSTSGIVVFDIPLLFETGSEAEFDAICCVYVSKEIQMERALARATMTRDQISTIISRQWPTDKKKSLSDYVVCTETLETANRDVEKTLMAINERLNNA